MGSDNSCKRIVFLCSGGGGNLKFIYYAIKNNWISGVEIAAVLTDRDCQANHFASAVGLKNQYIDFSDENQNTLIRELNKIQPDLIITTVHKILKTAVVEEYRDRLINLHYSLLPSFGGFIGMRPVKAAIDYGAKFTGVTAHLVDEHVDGGRPLVQATIPLYSNENDIDLINNLVFRCGCIALLTSIRLRTNPQFMELQESFMLMNRVCTFNPGDRKTYELIDEKFWEDISTNITPLPR